MGTGGGGRRLRADALRNRERLLEAAKAAFTEAGPEASLEEIARRAEVGIGTLYRHFPTRNDILAAVYRREVEQLGAAAERLLGEMAPADALRQWLRLSVDYLATKKVIAPALGTMEGGASALYAASSQHIRGAMDLLLERAIAAGEVRADVETADLVQALAGLAYNPDSPGWRERALRLIDILLAGLRAGTG
ncbi:MAG: TetR/AcrR family transcriptional regulator [Rhodospirillaceae bacterium]|nr:TetR/AcrR family transcriptional regulator [Rhodospirillaceae bacterium]MCA8931593.1 TetR/AcrR family transcriptional regulator [Rhodospirillaceae bacterium]